MAHMHPKSMQSLELPSMVRGSNSCQPAGMLSCTWLPGTCGSTTRSWTKQCYGVTFFSGDRAHSRAKWLSWEQEATKNDKIRHLGDSNPCGQSPADFESAFWFFCFFVFCYFFGLMYSELASMYSYVRWILGRIASAMVISEPADCYFFHNVGGGLGIVLRVRDGSPVCVDIFATRTSMPRFGLLW